MLQQTQAPRVEQYFPRFISQFPDMQSLAQADRQQVLKLWQGLGYYRRAGYLHRSAQLIDEHYQGSFPTEPKQLEALPGIGTSTAHAILAQLDNKQLAILDANVVRVLTRLYAIDTPVQQSDTRHRLWQLAQQHTPSQASPIHSGNNGFWCSSL